MISICCVGFASLDVVFAMNLMIVPGMFVCSRFLISVCMIIVSKATLLFTVCSAATVECCVLYPCCMGVFGTFAVI